MNRRIDQSNRIESPEFDPHGYSQLIFVTHEKAPQWRKDDFFNKSYWDNRIFIGLKKPFNLNLIPYTKINSK